LPGSIFVLCEKTHVACELVTRIARAGYDVIFAAHAHEAFRHLRQLDFAAAVIAWQVGADNVVAELDDYMVPYFMFGMPASGAAAIPGQPLVVTDLNIVVPTLVNLLSAFAGVWKGQ
jgi:hypothetical protein